MTTTPPPADEHAHTFGLEHDPQRPNTDVALLDHFIGAGFDGCTSCQDAQLTLLLQDPYTSARVVELACVAVQGVAGGLPPEMTTVGAAGTSSDEFRALARLGIDGGNETMFAACAEMTDEQRRAAVNTAANTLTGMMAMQFGPLLDLLPPDTDEEPGTSRSVP